MFLKLKKKKKKKKNRSYSIERSKLPHQAINETTFFDKNCNFDIVKESLFNF